MSDEPKKTRNLSHSEGDVEDVICKRSINGFPRRKPTTLIPALSEDGAAERCARLYQMGLSGSFVRHPCRPPVFVSVR